MVSSGDFNSPVSPNRPVSAPKSGTACGPDSSTTNESLPLRMAESLAVASLDSATWVSSIRAPNPPIELCPRRFHAANPSPPSIASKIAAGSHQFPATQSIHEPDGAGGAACLPFSEVGAAGTGAGTGAAGFASGAAGGGAEGGADGGATAVSGFAPGGRAAGLARGCSTGG